MFIYLFCYTCHNFCICVNQNKHVRFLNLCISNILKFSIVQGCGLTISTFSYHANFVVFIVQIALRTFSELASIANIANLYLLYSHKITNLGDLIFKIFERFKIFLKFALQMFQICQYVEFE